MSLTPPAYRTTLFYKNGTRYTDFSGAPSAYSRRIGTSSVIVDQTGRNGRFRPVSHTAESYNAKPIGSLYSTQYSYYAEGTSPTSVVYAEAYNAFFGVHGLRYGQFLGGVGSISNSLATVDWTNLAAAAVQAMLPSFHTSNSLVNFLLELKDFKSVVKYMSSGLKKKFDRIDTFIALDRKGIRNAHYLDVDKGKPLKWLSKRYLEYSFGWRPLYNDVVALYQTIAKFEQRYRELVRDADKPVQSTGEPGFPGQPLVKPLTTLTQLALIRPVGSAAF